MAHSLLLEMSFRGTVVISVFVIVKPESRCWYFEDVVTCFIAGIWSEGVCPYEGIILWIYS